MITRKRKGAETRKEAVRRQFRENADRINPSPAAQLLDGHGRPRKRRRRIILNPLPMKAD
jgi:hypothetical protein